MCSACCWKIHDTMLFHRIRKWNGHHYQAAALWQVGTKLYLGHNGRKCPSLGLVADGIYEVFGHADGAPSEAEEATLPGTEPWDGEEEMGEIYLERPSDSMLPIPPKTDTFGNPFVHIIHNNGIHQMPVVSCQCADQEEEDLAYIDLGYFPASFTKIRTTFTFGVLRAFRLANLECKSTAYQYYQMLRRLTCPAFPESTTNWYREFRRVYRLFRNLSLLRRFGFAHRNDLPGKADLALFCAACPQPGVNLSSEWKLDVNK